MLEYNPVKGGIEMAEAIPHEYGSYQDQTIKKKIIGNNRTISDIVMPILRKTEDKAREKLEVLSTRVQEVEDLLKPYNMFTVGKIKQLKAEAKASDDQEGLDFFKNYFDQNITRKAFSLCSKIMESSREFSNQFIADNLMNKLARAVYGLFDPRGDVDPHHDDRQKINKQEVLKALELMKPTASN